MDALDLGARGGRGRRCCPQLVAYTGDDLTALTYVADSGGQLQFSAEAGTTYRIALQNTSEFWGTLSWLVATKPANDDFADAQQLSGDAGTVSLSTYAASLEPGEQDAYTGSVWFAWTPSATGNARFTTLACCSGYVFVYEGDTLGGLTALAAWSSDQSVHVTGGTAYRIKVDTPSFAGTLHWSLALPPANDAFAAATDLGSGSGSLFVDTTGASTEPDEPGANGHSVWFTWTAGAKGA